MRVAYADPPYIGKAKKHYNADPNCAEVDHMELVRSLCSDFDSWALSCNSTTLQEILSYTPPGVRIGAWVKPFCTFKPGVNPAYAWEPVILWNGRKRGRERTTTRDWIIENASINKGLVGAKPAAFCFWLFEYMGLLPTD